MTLSCQHKGVPRRSGINLLWEQPCDAEPEGGLADYEISTAVPVSEIPIRYWTVDTSLESNGTRQTPCKHLLPAFINLAPSMDEAIHVHILDVDHSMSMLHASVID